MCNCCQRNANTEHRNFQWIKMAFYQHRGFLLYICLHRLFVSCAFFHLQVSIRLLAQRLLLSVFISIVSVLLPEFPTVDNEHFAHIYSMNSSRIYRIPYTIYMSTLRASAMEPTQINIQQLKCDN